MKTSFFFTLFFVNLFTFFGAEKLPSDIPLCKAADVKCIAKVATDLVRAHYTGRADVGIPQLDPYHIDTLTLTRPSSNSALPFYLTVSDFDVIGLSKLTVTKIVGFERDAKASKFEVVSLIPKVIMRGKYKANGRILILPIQGEGDIEIVLDDVIFEFKFKPKVMIKDSQNYLAIDKLKTLMTPSKVNFSLSNLFNGNKLLGDEMNRFLNENWKDVWQEYSPTIFVAIGNIVRNTSTELFQRFSYDDIFLPE